jgi:oxalyl-CoA decarboxylase
MVEMLRTGLEIERGIILGKGAAYAQADDAIRALVEKSGVPFLPMSMGKGLLPDTHPLCAGAARSTVLKDSDVVMLIGARLNWLLSHGKGKTWGEAPKKFIQIDIEPKEMDSNVEIVAPVVGDIGSCVTALLEGMDTKWPAPPVEWTSAVAKKREENVAKMAPRLMNNNSPMDYHGALGVLRTVIKERPDAILVNEGANTLDLARGIIDMYQPRKRIDVGTWGIMGIGMGYAIAASIETGKPVLAVEGDSAFGFSGMEVETICRYKLPICIVIFNNDGIYRGTDSNAASDDPATTVFVKGARYDRMMEAFGGVGINAPWSRRCTPRSAASSRSHRKSATATSRRCRRPSWLTWRRKVSPRKSPVARRTCTRCCARCATPSASSSRCST